MLIFKERYLVPLVEGGLGMSPVKKVKPVLVVDLEVRRVDLVLNLVLPLPQALEEMCEDPRYQSSLLPGVSAAHRVRLSRSRLPICKDRTIVAS